MKKVTKSKLILLDFSIIIVAMMVLYLIFNQINKQKTEDILGNNLSQPISYIYSPSILQYQNSYYYTQDFKEPSECNVALPSDSFTGCGLQEFSLNNHTIGIYCASINQESSMICDQFINNLEVE